MKAQKKYYAIKVGNNINNKIVTTWDECKKYVLYYNSIYKSFKNKKQAQKWLEDLTYDEVEKRLKKQIKYYNKNLKEKIIMNLKFDVDSKMLNFIINNKENYEKIENFINLNIENKKISKNKAEVLKNYLQTDFIKNT